MQYVTINPNSHIAAFTGESSLWLCSKHLAEVKQDGDLERVIMIDPAKCICQMCHAEVI